MKPSLIFFIIILVFFSFACSDFPDDVSIPKWKTEYNLPLTNKKYALSDLIREDKYVSVDTNNGFRYVIHFFQETKKSGFGEYFQGILDYEKSAIEIPIAEGKGSAGMPFTEGLFLDSAIVKSGDLSLSIVNTSSDTIVAIITIPALISPFGDSFSRTIVAPGGDSIKLVEDLSDYVYSSSHQTVGKDSMQINGEIVKGEQEGKLIASYKIENSSLKYVAGVIPPSSLNPKYEYIVFPITKDLKQFRDKTNLYEAKINIKANYFKGFSQNDPHNSFNYRIDTLYCFGLRNDNTEKFYLKLNDKNDDNLGPVNSVNSNVDIVYTAENANLSDFLSFLPAQVQVYASKTIINPNGENGAASEKDSLNFSLSLEVQSVLSFENLVLNDTTEFEMDEDAKDNVKDIDSATIFFEISNKIAFGGYITASLLDSNYAELSVLDTFAFEPANIDENGFSSPATSKAIVALDSAQIADLTKVSRVALKAVFKTSQNENNKKAVFSSQDWINIISYCKIKYRLDLND